MPSRRLLRLTTALLLLGGLGLARCGGSDGGPATPAPPVDARAPDFALPDVNPASATYEADVSPRDHLGRVSAWYFGHATWGYCRAQFGHLDLLQQDLDGAGLPTAVRILGVNGMGLESGNAETCQGRTLPWLQDQASVDAWTRWQVAYRDVVVLDEQNRLLFVYNLTEHDLGDPANLAELHDLLVAAAGG